MSKNISVGLTGPNVAETANALGMRLIELGYNAEVADAAVVERLGGPEPAVFACGLLVRNGVIVIDTLSSVRPDGERLDIEIDENDTPDFAAEKILDDLAGVGAITLEETGYSPEEEERIRERLASLGYIE
ncbi:MAG: hypothetical protein GWP08_05440 [Nitrospiraceae bacterium]|nr:hypothetical protein [Nitrospiraceae bacterium]